MVGPDLQGCQASGRQSQGHGVLYWTHYNLLTAAWGEPRATGAEFQPQLFLPKAPSLSHSEVPRAAMSLGLNQTLV